MLTVESRRLPGSRSGQRGPLLGQSRRPGGESGWGQPPFGVDVTLCKRLTKGPNSGSMLGGGALIRAERAGGRVLF